MEGKQIGAFFDPWHRLWSASVLSSKHLLYSIVFFLYCSETSFAGPIFQNSIADYVFKHKSGSVALSSIIAERSGEIACLVGKGPDLTSGLAFRLDRETPNVVTPPVDEHLLQDLWKIVILTDDTAAVYYFDERDVEFENELELSNLCVPLDGAILEFRPGASNFLAKLSYAR